MEELYCSDCGQYISFPIRRDLTGDYIIVCPKCRHQHCRNVVDGIVTGDRWGDLKHGKRKKGPADKIVGRARPNSTFDTFSGNKNDGGFLYRLWNNRQ